MNEKYMKHGSKSRTNWDKLRRGDDRDISYADIPKTTKDSWKDAELFVPSDKVHLSLRAEKCTPFSINIPNAVTRAVLEAIERGEGLEETSLARLIKDWDDACGSNSYT
jgi:hypothetical protein